MFYDMAILVEEQGEMIDLIEHNVELAAAHVEVGQQNIRRAAEYSSSNRRVSQKFDYFFSRGILGGGGRGDALAPH